MSVTRRAALLGTVMVLGLAATWLGAADQGPPQDRAALMKLHKDGNFKNAYDGLRKLALDPTDDPAKVSNDLDTGINCLQRLGRVEEVDEFREGVVAAHAKNWRLLQTAARSYTQVEHQGFIVAGKFDRGYKRGGGRLVNAMQRDRTRALQLMQQGLAQTKGENDKAALADFHVYFAQMLLQGSGWHEPWRLQYLTDLAKLPDYDDGYYYYSGNDRGAPVDADNNPVYHQLPKDYDKAQSDGQRWRWMLSQAVEFNPGRRNEVDMIFANFLYGQFGVQTMQHVGSFAARDEDNKDKSKTGTFALATLGEDETIARLASGLKRFKLPDEYNWIKIYQQVAGRGKSKEGESARDTLASIFENRRQYVPAATAWKQAIADYGVGPKNHRQNRLDQIVSNWARFESFADQAAGGFQPMTAAEMEALSKRCAAAAGDGHLELYKSTMKYDGDLGRHQHGVLPTKELPL